MSTPPLKSSLNTTESLAPVPPIKDAMTSPPDGTVPQIEPSRAALATGSGVQVPGYEILGELGRGGMGVVYLARNVLMDRREVLKVVNKALLDRPGVEERFLREIRAAAMLNHNHVVKAYSAVQAGESVIFAMEYVDGEDLAKVVRRQGPLPIPDACHYISQAALGLQHAHKHQMVHRDIKPPNLILSRQGKRHVVKILDFGLAKAQREGEAVTDLTGAGAMMGTPAYMAPEQARDAATADIRADIYSLGCTLYFLLTGAPPFTGRSHFEVLKAHESTEAAPLSQMRAEAPAELEAVVAKMMAKDPARRYQTPIGVAKALAPIIKSGAPGAKTAAPPAEPLSADPPRRESEIKAAVPPLSRPPALGPGPTQPPQPARQDETDLAAHDRAFPFLAEQIAAGSKLIVLTGPPGIGKTVTALELARRYTPADSGRRPVIQIDAREEFHEASLAEAVGEAYPDEFYGEPDGRSYSTLSFGAQRHVAADLLRKKGAAVILDGPGEAPYPRDSAAELELALRMAKDLSGKAVLVLITTRNESWWAGFHPTRLRGLSPNDARAIFRREFLRCSPSSSLDDLANRFDEEGAFRQQIERGCPGELIAAARLAAVGAPAGEQTSPGVLGRTAGLIRRAVEALLGDPVLLPPRAPAVQSAGWGRLAVVCVVLLLASLLFLIAAYESRSVLWARMFDQTPTQASQVPSLAVAAANAGGPTPGLLVEFTRAVIIIFGFLFVVVGRFLGKEAAALLPHAPWARLGPRRLGLRSLFRVSCLVLAAWLGYTTFVHHMSRGPRILWMCNGNPLLQDCLNANDQEQTKKHQEEPPEAPERMNGEPPGEGGPGYEKYWWQCVLPYRLYFGYSFIMFVIVAPTVLTVCFYTVVSSLGNHLIAQPRLIRGLRDDAAPEVVENRLRYCKQTYVEDIERYLAFLLVLLGAWAYHLWWDQYNMTGMATAETTRLILVTLGALGMLLAVLLLTYQALVQEAAKRIPEGPVHDAFHQRHVFFRFFPKTVLRSAYFWLCVAAGGAAALWRVVAALGGWQR